MNRENNTVIIEKPEQRTIEIGDSKRPDAFIPQTKLAYWDNECNFSVRLKDVEYEKGAVEEKGGVIEWAKDGRIARFYEKPNDEFEFEVELASRPASNVLEFTIESKELDFFYQPELTQEEIDDGCVRPDNVVGSYAVYHKTRRHSRIGGKAYKTGKALHIYRPHADDSAGKRVWCDLRIAEGLMTITIPQDFLDTAVYPIIVDPTLGDTSFGGSNGTRSVNALIYIEIGSATEDGTVTSVHLALDGNGVGTVNAKGILLDDADASSVIASNGVTPSAVLDATAGGVYKAISYSSSPSIVNGSPYAAGSVADATTRYYYDNTASLAWFDDSNSYATPQNIGGSATGTTRDFSYYITYTAAGGSLIKTIDGLAIASVKTVDGLAIASVKTVDGLTNV